MPQFQEAALLWSGGKDSALALHEVCGHDSEVRVNRLVTCVSQTYDRVSMHGVRRQLIEDQAQALGLPVEFVVIPDAPPLRCPLSDGTPGASFPANDVYTQAMSGAFQHLRGEGIGTVVFGDIFLQDLRAFRDRLLHRAGLKGCYPLWSRDPRELYDRFCLLQFQAITVCDDLERLSAEHCGRLLTPEFRASLPVGADPCGERGEYHSFTFDGPLFREPVRFELGGAHRQHPFLFRELYPSKGVAGPHQAAEVMGRHPRPTRT